MTARLRLSPDLTMPPEVITDTLAILGTRGGGKSSSGVVLVEEAYRLHLPTVILDPKGDWWGLRSASDGSKAGLPFYIFGGDHADVPLEPTAGALIADLIVDDRPHAVLDLSTMSKTGARRFAMDFAERLYRRNRDPLLVVVDEADIIIPQRAAAETMRLLGAWEDIAKRGRGRGLGMVVITQRPQDVSKSVLDEMHALLLHGLIGPRAIKAVKDWIEDNADEGATVADVLGSLRTLTPGEGWMWAPMQGLLRRVQVRRIETFDSHATPTAGQVRKQPKGLAEVDLAALDARIRATVDEAKANDPRTLRARIVELEKALAGAESAAPEPVRVEVPVLTDDHCRLLDLAAQAAGLAAKTAAEAAGEVKAAADVYDDAAKRLETALAAVERRNPPPAARHLPVKPPARQAPVSRATDTGTAPAHDADPDKRLSKAERRILTALAQHGTLTTVQAAILTNYSHKSGGYRNALSGLRTAGYVDGRGDITITDDGLAALGHYDPLPTGPALRDWWVTSNHLGKAEKMILGVLADAYPSAVPVTEIAEITEYSATSGGFRNACSRLRSLQLAEGRGELRISDTLMGA
jgi:hypothetical protein